MAVWQDLKYQRIPNQLIVLGICVGVGLMIFSNEMTLKEAALGFLVGLSLLMPFYVMRMLGAGDVKLMATIGLLVGYPAIMKIVLSTLICGALLSILIAIWHKELLNTFKNIFKYIKDHSIQISSGLTNNDPKLIDNEKIKLPYAAAIMLGTMSYFLKT